MISDTINFETLGFIKFLKAGNQTITLFENSGNLFLSNSESTISGRLMSETNVLTDPILVTDLATNPIFIDALAKALTATNKLTALATNPIFLNALAKALTTTNNTNYNIASKLNQTISFSSIPIQTYKFGKTIAFTATSSSKLPVVYSCENTSIGIIHDNILLLQGSGTTTITASQVGSQYYNPASATKPLIVK